MSAQMKERERRQSVVAEIPDMHKQVEECTPVELLMVALWHAQQGAEEHRSDRETGREFSIAATTIEDAIGRMNKGKYRADGKFGITDAWRTAEMIADEGRS